MSSEVERAREEEMAEAYRNRDTAATWRQRGDIHRLKSVERYPFLDFEAAALAAQFYTIASMVEQSPPPVSDSLQALVAEIIDPPVWGNSDRVDQGGRTVSEVERAREALDIMYAQRNILSATEWQMCRRAVLTALNRQSDAIAAERERCAKIAEDWNAAGEPIAAAIRSEPR